MSHELTIHESILKVKGLIFFDISYMAKIDKSHIIKLMKIVIIDDEVEIGTILSFELKRLNHQIVCFTSILEAKNHLEKHLPDAVLCDFQMPEGNGEELFHWLKEQNINCDFYLITGDTTMNTASLLKQGIKDILHKPQDLLRLSSIFK